MNRVFFVLIGMGFLGGGIRIRRPEAVPTVTVCQVQGAGTLSPYAEQTVRTEGVVVGDFDSTGAKGFFIEHSDCDGNEATSDGVFVYLGVQTNLVSAGDWVRVEGTVAEYFGMTRIALAPEGVTVLANGQPLPAPVDLSPPADPAASKSYWEAREGMLARVAEGTVVGPTNSAGELWLVDAAVGVARIFRDAAPGPGVVVLAGPGWGVGVPSGAHTGDRVQGLVGVVDFSGGLFRVQPVQPVGWVPAAETFVPPAVQPLFSGVTFNLENLFDTTDDPNTADPVLTASAYQRKLKKLALALHALGEPPLVAVQEAENGAVLQALANRPELGADYAYVWVNGPDARGIDVALLYRLDQATVAGFEALQGCTSLVDGLGPDGNRDMAHPVNALTCDSDGNGSLDGNRLFSRPPLRVDMVVCGGPCGVGVPAWPLRLLVNHWKSKTEDTAQTEYTLPRRLEQAQFVAGLTAGWLAEDPLASVVVLGDFNDLPGSAPMQALAQAGLVDLWERAVPGERYSYVYQGVSQALDYIWVSPALATSRDVGVRAFPFRLNADFPALYAGVDSTAWRSSDHDPVWAAFFSFRAWVFLACLP